MKLKLTVVALECHVRQEIVMNEKIDNFCKELRTKLDDVDKRLRI
jgi:hypothetical protein